MMKHRVRWILIVPVAIILASLGVGLVWRAHSVSKVSFESQLTLVDRPEGYCPTTVPILVVDAAARVIFNQIISVNDCQSINLSSVMSGANGQLTIYFKPPQALARSVVVNAAQVTRLTEAILLGDATGDNIIDQEDENFVQKHLFSTELGSLQKAADLDRDGKVTALDLSLTRLNRGVGQTRPDHKSWQEGALR